MSSPPDPPRRKPPPGTRRFRQDQPFRLHHGGELLGYELAYECWGQLAPRADNAVLVCTGLSASSHLCSHEGNPEPGWWEGVVGPGAAIDTERWFVICVNVLGGCHGSTGPSTMDPGSGKAYGSSFPLLSVWDFVATQRSLLDELGIARVDTVLGASMGGMQALAFAAAYPEGCRRLIAISAPGRSYPLSISLRFVQRQALMRDPDWQGGAYHPGVGPRRGLHLARQNGTAVLPAKVA